MLKIAITGNIASGKSLVEAFFKNSGYETLCLDKVTAFLYEHDHCFRQKLIKLFKTDKKSEISKFIFKDREKLHMLEDLIYPAIKEYLFTFFMEKTQEKAVFVSAPMLFEKNFDKYFDKIIFVSSCEENRLQRLMRRNNLSKKDAINRILAQDGESDKILHSDFIIYNNSDLKNLENECKKIKEELELLL